MSEYTVLLRFGVAGVVIMVAYAIGHHYGYAHGSEDKVAYYEPILREAADAKIAADGRATAAQLRAVKITSDVEQAHADIYKTLSDRATVAEQRIAVLLRQRTSPPANSRVEVSGVPAGAPERASPAPSDERDDRFAASVSSVGEQCEHDARELAEWQQWYERQRASLLTSN